MQFIIRFLLPALISTSVALLLAQIDNEKTVLADISKEHIVIRLPRAYLWVGCVDISFFALCLLLMTWFPNDSATAWVWIVFGLFILLGAAIVVSALCWRIDLFRSKDYFTIRTLPIRTHRVAYRACEFYKCSANALTLKTTGRTFHIDTHATNFEFLPAMLKQYKVPEKHGKSK